MRKRIVFTPIGLALIALVILRIIQASTGGEAAVDVDQIRQQTGIPVEVAEARTGTLVVHRSFTGTIRGIRSILDEESVVSTGITIIIVFFRQLINNTLDSYIFSVIILPTR